MKDNWDKIDILSKFLTNGLLVLIAFIIKQEADRIAQTNEESKIINALIADLAKKEDNQHNDVALLSLEKFLMQKNSAKRLPDVDKNYVVQVAETLIRERIDDDSAFNSRSSIPFRLWLKYDSVAASLFLNEYISKPENTVITVADKQFLKDDNLEQVAPVAESKTATEASIIGSLQKKICYIQYRSKELRPLAKKMQDTLQSTGWLAPGIEMINGNYSNSIKYFHEDDEKIAKNLAARLKGTIQRDFKIVSMTGSKYKVPKGQLETWIGE